MKKILTLLLTGLLLGISYSFAAEEKRIEGGTVRLSLGYQSQGVCESSKDSNNTAYPDYIRSSCLQSGSLYYYYICDKGNSFCKNAGGNLNLGTSASQDTNPLTSVSATGNPFASNVSVGLLPKLSQATTKLEGLTLSKLQLINSKLTKLSPNYKDKPALLNVIKYLQFETVRLINEKQGKLTGIDDILAAIENPSNDTIDTSGTGTTEQDINSSSEQHSASNNPSDAPKVEITPLMKEDIASKGFGYGSMKTLVGTHKGKKVEIMDMGSSPTLPPGGFITYLPNGNGMNTRRLSDISNRQAWKKYNKGMTPNTIYAIRKGKSSGESLGAVLSLNNTAGLNPLFPANSYSTEGGATVVLSQVPGKLEKSEFRGYCSFIPGTIPYRDLKGNKICYKNDDGSDICHRNTMPRGFRIVTSEGREKVFNRELAKYTSNPNIVTNFRVSKALGIPGRLYKASNPEDVEWLKKEYLPTLIDHTHCTIPKGTNVYVNIEPGKFVNTLCQTEAKKKGVDCVLGVLIGPPINSIDMNANQDAREVMKLFNDADKKHNYYNGQRYYKGSYALGESGSCVWRNEYTNACSCSPGFEPYKRYTGSSSYICRNATLGAVNGQCGSSHGGKVSADSISGTELCYSGISSSKEVVFKYPRKQNITYSQAVNDDTLAGQMGGSPVGNGSTIKRTWSCRGLGGGVQRQCSAQYSTSSYAGVCGTSAGVCQKGTPTTTELGSDGKSRWYCLGENYGKNQFCFAEKK